MLKKFAGKWYDLEESTRTKREAQKLAKKFRAKYYVRVARTGYPSHPWAIYIRKK